MPRPPQQTVSREDITRALLHLITQGGFEAVSLRHVSEVAGCSLGLLQRQFGTKDALIAEAIQHAASLTEQRLQACLVTLAAHTSHLARVHAYLSALLSLTPEHRPLAVIWVNIQTKATTNPELRKALKIYAYQSVDTLAALIEQGQQAGEFSDTQQARQTALTLLALTDGLMLNLLTEIMTIEEARTILNWALQDHLLFRAGV